MPGPVVVTQCGELRGVNEKSIEGFDYCAFKGIPYAVPPKGELRFKDPVPVAKWAGTKNATRFGSIAAQFDIFSGIISDDEDCLYLNVYTKSISDTEYPKAVMVYFHGGGFYFGSSHDDIHGPDYIIAKDVVLVTVGFRLGIFGFLDLEDEVASGNQGLKDQVLALQWVHDNIRAFGGNANNITIFGESSGGFSVHYLTLSPLAEGLFHKAISQSGVSYSPLARSQNPKEMAQKLCFILGQDLTDSCDILDFLKTVDAKILCESQEKLRKQYRTVAFGPGVDSKSSNPFMPIQPEVAGQQGVHVPYLVGHTSNEGIFFLLGISKKEAFSMIDRRFEASLIYNSKLVLDNYNLTPDQMRRVYYKSEKVSEANLEKYANLTGDLIIVEGIHRFIKEQVEKSSAPVYMYHFAYDSGFSMSKAMMKENILGACHLDDMGYIFKMNILSKFRQPHLRKGSREYKVMQRMTEMWTNFAKFGKPTIALTESIPVHWLPVNDGKILRHLNIDEDLTMQSMLNIEQKFLSIKDIKA